MADTVKAQFRALGWDIESIADAAQELERLCGMARVEIAQRIAAEFRAENAEATLAAIRDRCRVIYFPPDGAYPLEHNPRAFAAPANEMTWQMLLYALAATPPAGRASPAETEAGG